MRRVGSAHHPRGGGGVHRVHPTRFQTAVDNDQTRRCVGWAPPTTPGGRRRCTECTLQNLRQQWRTMIGRVNDRTVDDAVHPCGVPAEISLEPERAALQQPRVKPGVALHLKGSTCLTTRREGTPAPQHFSAFWRRAAPSPLSSPGLCAKPPGVKPWAPRLYGGRLSDNSRAKPYGRRRGRTGLQVVT